MPEVLEAEIRTESGTRAANKIRKQGKTPGILFSLPNAGSALLSFKPKELGQLVNVLGRTGWACRVFEIRIIGDTIHPEGLIAPGETYRAVGRQIHMDPATFFIENVTLMHCPPDRIVRVDVPIRLVGTEVCPGLKMGGRVNWLTRTIPITVPGDMIPTHVDMDVSGLTVGDKLYYDSLSLPEGMNLLVKDPKMPVIKIMKK